MRRNPLKAEFSQHLHPSIVRHVNRLDARRRHYARMAARAYAQGNFEQAEDFDAAADELTEQLEAYLSELEGEYYTGGEEAAIDCDLSIEEEMADLYAAYRCYLGGDKWARSGTFLHADDSDDPMAELTRILRHVVALRPYMKPLASASDEELLAAARDAYEAQLQLQRRRRGQR